MSGGTDTGIDGSTIDSNDYDGGPSADVSASTSTDSYLGYALGMYDAGPGVIGGIASVIEQAALDVAAVAATPQGYGMGYSTDPNAAVDVSADGNDLGPNFTAFAEGDEMVSGAIVLGALAAGNGPLFIGTVNGAPVMSLEWQPGLIQFTVNASAAYQDVANGNAGATLATEYTASGWQLVDTHSGVVIGSPTFPSNTDVATAVSEGAIVAANAGAYLWFSAIGNTPVMSLDDFAPYAAPFKIDASAAAADILKGGGSGALVAVDRFGGVPGISLVDSHTAMIVGSEATSSSGT